MDWNDFFDLARDVGKGFAKGVVKEALGIGTDFVKIQVKHTVFELVKGKIAILFKVLIMLSAAFTLVGIIGFKVVAHKNKFAVQSLAAANDMVGIGSVMDKLMLFATFLRIGVFCMLLFVTILMIFCFCAGFNPGGPIVGFLMMVTCFILSFQLSVYCSVSKMTAAGLENLINPGLIKGTVPVNILMGFTIAEFAFALIGIFMLDDLYDY